MIATGLGHSSETKQQLINFVIYLINKLLTIRVIPTGLGHSSEIKQKEKEKYLQFFYYYIEG